MPNDTQRPARVQRKRARGYRTPANTVYVGRPTRWGNPFVIGEPLPIRRREMYGVDVPRSAAQTVDLYRVYLDRELGGADAVRVALRSLRGKNFSCWCALCARHRDGRPFDKACLDCAPCHADVLLELANAESRGARQ